MLNKTDPPVISLLLRICTTLVPFNQGYFMSSLVEIGQVILEKIFFLNFVNVFSLFRNYFPLEESVTLCLKESESLHKKMLWA